MEGTQPHKEASATTLRTRIEPTLVRRQNAQNDIVRRLSSKTLDTWTVSNSICGDLDERNREALRAEEERKSWQRFFLATVLPLTVLAVCLYYHFQVVITVLLAFTALLVFRVGDEG